MSAGQEYYYAFVIGAVFGPLLYDLLCAVVAVVRGGGER